MAKKSYDDDDGRVIADMSGLPERNALGQFRDVKKAAKKESVPVDPGSQMSKSEEFWTIMGALKAALLIGLVFVVGLSLVVWFLTLIW